MASFCYYDQNPSVFAFLCKLGLFYLNSLRVVPQVDHASKEIEWKRAKKKKEKPRGSWGGGGKGGRDGSGGPLFFLPFPSFLLGYFALSSPAELRLA